MSLTYPPLGTIAAKDAVKVAKATIEEFFADEGPGDVGLEELIFDDALERWEVTIGFTRPWASTADHVQNALLTALQGGKRDFKVVSVSKTGDVVGLRNRVF